jgi:hypothetical protein
MLLLAPRRSRALALAALVATAGASSCATYSDKTEEARRALRRADYEESIEQWNEILKVRSAEKLPDKWKKNYGLVILERATVLQAMRDYELSSRDFQVADKELELLDIARDGAGKLGKYIYSDDATKFKASPTEKLSLNAMNMCNYLTRGDLNGAKVEAKRFTVMRKYLSDYDPEHEHGAFGSYLAGFVHEKLGEPDAALRYYEEALQERELGSLREPIRRLAQKGSFRGERIKEYLPVDDGGFVSPTTPRPRPEAPKTEPPAEATPTDDGKPEEGGSVPPAPEVQRPTPPAGELGAIAPSSAAWAVADPSATAGEILVVAKTGRVPFKVPERIPIGAAIGIAGAFVTGDTTLLEYGMFKVVTYPELVSAENMFVDAKMRIDGKDVPMEEATDLGSEIAAEYEEIKPKIIGAALTRMIARAAAAEGARAAGRQADGAGGLVGFLAAAAVEGTLVALDKPDTRSWSTLPDRVHVGRLVVPPGRHTVEVTVFGPGGKERHTTEVEVTPGGFAVVDVTTLR